VTGIRIAFSLPLLFLLFSPVVALCQNEILKQELTTQQQRLKSIEESIQKRKSKKRQILRSQHDVLSEIENLDRRIGLQWESLQKAKRDWTQAELDLEKTKQALNATSKKIEALKRHIETRLNAFRQMGQLGFLNVMFASDSIPDFLSRQEYLKMILDEDRARRREYIDSIAQLTRQEEALRQKQVLLKAMSTRLEKEMALLEAQRVSASLGTQQTCLRRYGGNVAGRIVWSLVLFPLRKYKAS